MIVKMQKATILCLEDDRSETLDALRDLGVLHLVPLSTPRGQELAQSRDRLKEARLTRATLDAYRKKPNGAAPAPGPETGDQVLEKVRTLVERRKTMAAELEALRREKLALEPYGPFDPATITGTLYPRQYMPLFWKKWLEDIRESQFENGAIPDIAPNYLQWKAFDPAWGGNYPIMVWYLYRYYDDVRILEDHYGSMCKLMSYFSSIEEGGIIDQGHFGDHMMPGSEPGKEIFVSEETPPPFVWTGYYYRGAVCLAKAAEILDRTADVELYANLAERIKSAMLEKWLNRDDCHFSTGSQTAAFFALVLGIVPEAYKPRLVANAVEDIREKYDLHHHTGNTGTTCLIDTLTQYGHGQLLYDMINQESYPGWGYMMAQGATTIWESWSDDNTAGCELSMSMYATIDEFFYNDLAGIIGPDYYGPEPFETGFAKVVIAPLIPKNLDSAGATMQTVRGRISSKWKKDEIGLTLEVSIPPNSEGIVRVPTTSPADTVISESGKPLWKGGAYIEGIDGIKAAKSIEDKRIVQISIGSGDYKFSVSSESGTTPLNVHEEEK